MNLKVTASTPKAKDVNSSVEIEIKSKPRAADKSSLQNSDNNIDKNQAYGTGRRKGAVARVWVKNGTGAVTINKKPLEVYFPNLAHKIAIQKVFEVSEVLGQYDLVCTVKGGGCSGQAGAIRHGLARALDKLVPSVHKILRDSGFLTRDSRVVERKKYGKHGARRSTQFSKR